MDELLRLLKQNAHASIETMARMLDTDEDSIREQIAAYEKQGVIRGYQAIIDETRLETDTVTAIIEVKVAPEREGGFDHIANRISRFEEVESSFLVSGSSDLLLFVRGKSLHDVAMFVSQKLATIQGVKATNTAFMLKPYKYNGLLMASQDQYERLKVTP